MEHPEPFEAFDYPAPKHAGLGIASFVIGLAAALLDFALVIIAGVLELSTPGGIDEDSPVAGLLGLGLIGGLLLALLGVGLGIAGLCQRHRKKVFAVLGVAIGSVVVLGVLFLIVAGLTMG